MRFWRRARDITDLGLAWLGGGACLARALLADDSIARENREKTRMTNHGNTCFFTAPLVVFETPLAVSRSASDFGVLRVFRGLPSA